MLRFSAVLLAALALTGNAISAPVYYTADAVLPGGLATLTAERNSFQAGAAGMGISLSTEGFESFSAGNPIDFGPFSVQVFSGSGFSQISGNNLITTEGNSVLSFNTSGSTSVEFSFDDPINAFGVDITSIDFAPTTVSFEDDLGNVLGNFAISGTFAGATFFGVTNNQAFSLVRFEFTGSEILNFDHLQFGSAIPEPTSLTVFALAGLVGCGVLRRRKARVA